MCAQDDAHAVRDARLGIWEQHPGLRANYTARAAQHAQRQRKAYALADTLLHISQADSDSERAAFPFVRHVGLLRLSLTRIASDLSAHTRARGGDDAPPSGRVIGFLGNGQTPTNHLAVQWFLNSCWASLRAKTPDLRLRLIGLPPGYKVGADGSERKCDPQEDVHCGWAWGTPYLGLEDRHGIDTLGFVSQACNRAQSGVIGRNRA